MIGIRTNSLYRTASFRVWCETTTNNHITTTTTIHVCVCWQQESKGVMFPNPSRASFPYSYFCFGVIVNCSLLLASHERRLKNSLFFLICYYESDGPTSRRGGHGRPSILQRRRLWNLPMHCYFIRVCHPFLMSRQAILCPRALKRTSFSFVGKKTQDFAIIFGIGTRGLVPTNTQILAERGQTHGPFRTDTHTHKHV